MNGVWKRRCYQRILVRRLMAVALAIAFWSGWPCADEARGSNARDRVDAKLITADFVSRLFNRPSDVLGRLGHTEWPPLANVYVQTTLPYWFVGPGPDVVGKPGNEPRRLPLPARALWRFDLTGLCYDGTDGKTFTWRNAWNSRQYVFRKMHVANNPAGVKGTVLQVSIGDVQFGALDGCRAALLCYRVRYSSGGLFDTGSLLYLWVPCQQRWICEEDMAYPSGWRLVGEVPREQRQALVALLRDFIVARMRSKINSDLHRHAGELASLLFGHDMPYATLVDMDASELSGVGFLYGPHGGVALIQARFALNDGWMSPGPWGRLPFDRPVKFTCGAASRILGALRPPYAVSFDNETYNKWRGEWMKGGNDKGGFKRLLSDVFGQRFGPLYGSAQWPAPVRAMVEFVAFDVQVRGPSQTERKAPSAKTPVRTWPAKVISKQAFCVVYTFDSVRRLVRPDELWLLDSNERPISVLKLSWEASPLDSEPTEFLRNHGSLHERQALCVVFELERMLQARRSSEARRGQH